MTAAVVSNRALFSVSTPLSGNDRILSSFSMNTPFGMGIAFQALWEGEDFVCNRKILLTHYMQERVSAQSLILDFLRLVCLFEGLQCIISHLVCRRVRQGRGFGIRRHCCISSNHTLRSAVGACFVVIKCFGGRQRLVSLYFGLEA
jgi:hypothetical protein